MGFNPSYLVVTLSSPQSVFLFVCIISVCVCVSVWYTYIYIYISHIYKSHIYILHIIHIYFWHKRGLKNVCWIWIYILINQKHCSLKSLEKTLAICLLVFQFDFVFCRSTEQESFPSLSNGFVELYFPSGEKLSALKLVISLNSGEMPQQDIRKIYFLFCSL